ncbi:YlbG family protein [Bacillus ndiopicus]|uniref:YlbG family protein n=1 Tax=Bacillus ndiopicus TaxID=1347368 RepID=UPI0005A83CBD|nr:YlbG family protein [Bacillus ndiopicus]
MNERQGLIVYVNQLKHAKSLRKYGHVHYISRKLKYVVMYCQREDVEATKNKLQRLPFVKDVVESFRPFLKTEFENAKPDKAKEYDYKSGL